MRSMVCLLGKLHNSLFYHRRQAPVEKPYINQAFYKKIDSILISTRSTLSWSQAWTEPGEPWRYTTQIDFLHQLHILRTDMSGVDLIV